MDIYEHNVILHNMRADFVSKQIEVWGFDYISDLFDRGYEPQLIHNRDTGEHTWTWIVMSVSPTHNRALARV